MKVHQFYHVEKRDLNPKFDGDFGKFKRYEHKLRSIPEAIRTKVLNTAVGIEIEVENAMPTANVSGWLSKGDGSLRNSGVEHITKYGCRVHEVPTLMQNIHGWCNLYNPERHYSERCSVHVHLDVRRFEGSQLQNLLILYTVIEDALFRMCSPVRKENIFCVPLRQHMPLNIGTDNIWTYIRGWQKYNAINLGAMSIFGTVEFRHMDGNDDPETINTWVFMLALLVQAAKEYETDFLKSVIKKLKTHSQYEQFLRTIFFDFTEYLPWQGLDLDSAVSDAKCFFNLPDKGAD